MAMQAKAFAKCVGGMLEPEDLRAPLIKRAVGDEVVDVSAWFEIGIQLDQWRWPEPTGFVRGVDWRPQRDSNPCRHLERVVS